MEIKEKITEKKAFAMFADAIYNAVHPLIKNHDDTGSWRREIDERLAGREEMRPEWHNEDLGDNWNRAKVIEWIESLERQGYQAFVVWALLEVVSPEQFIELAKKYAEEYAERYKKIIIA